MKPIYQVLSAMILLVLSACNTANVATPTPVATKTVKPPTLTPNTALSIKFEQKFTPIKCSADSPKAAFCLDVSGTATDPVLGAITMTRVAVLDIAGKKDENECFPASTSGTLTVGSDEISFATTSGLLCARTGSATYVYSITGGTGQYATASGAGTIYVPPPTGKNSGTESWSGTLLK